MNLTQTAVINGHDIKNMLLGAYAAFAAGYRQIDELNVFPVPDGDTGTNMMRTMEAVHRALLPLDTAVRFCRLIRILRRRLAQRLPKVPLWARAATAA